jgi:NAD(P)-dependent dehydrogenase (short-subunit alcohol dehydrogenase family)
MTPRPQSEGKDYKAAGKLKGKAAIVTGGDSGIGRATAVAFAKEGADVAIVYLNEHDDAAKTKHLIEQEGVRCLALAGDVGDERFCRKVIDETVTGTSTSSSTMPASSTRRTASRTSRASSSSARSAPTSSRCSI